MPVVYTHLGGLVRLDKITFISELRFMWTGTGAPDDPRYIHQAHAKVRFDCVEATEFVVLKLWCSDSNWDAKQAREAKDAAQESYDHFVKKWIEVVEESRS